MPSPLFVRAPAGLWMVARVCTFLFLIWLSDAAVLYAFMIGAEHLPYDLPWLIRLERHIVSFELWGALMGSVLALIIFAISAFSVPLLHEGRVNPVQAVHASVRAVFGSFPASIAWGVVLTGATLLPILVLPLLLVTLPVLAYAGFALYVSVFRPRKTRHLSEQGAPDSGVQPRRPGSHSEQPIWTSRT